MKALKLQKSRLNDYLGSLAQFGEVWGPVRKGDKFVYDRLDDLGRLDLSMLRTIIPLKKFLFPPQFTTLRRTAIQFESALALPPKRIVFGVHPCEIHGTLILDKLFKERIPDPYFAAFQSQTIIIGHSCVPDDKCFARSTNTHFVEEGFDLFFTDLDDYYLVWVGSSVGDDLMRSRLDLFDEVITIADQDRYIRWRKWRDNQYQLRLDLTAMPDIMELAYASPTWSEMGDKCLSCGMCSMVCPTCPCFSVHDRLNVDAPGGDRVRVWDSCMFKNFALVAGGHNFREQRSNRVRQWYTHKLKAFITEFGKPACIGCGRCIDTCPVDINVKEVSNRLHGGETGGRNG